MSIFCCCYVACNFHQIDGLVQERRWLSANALELRLSCTKPSKYPVACYFVLWYVLTKMLFELITQVVVSSFCIKSSRNVWFQLILIKICSWMITGNHMKGFWSNRNDKILCNNKIAFPWRNRKVFYHRDDSSWNIENACVIIIGNLSCLHRHLNKPSPDMCSD